MKGSTKAMLLKFVHFHVLVANTEEHRFQTNTPKMGLVFGDANKLVLELLPNDFLQQQLTRSLVETLVC